MLSKISSKLIKEEESHIAPAKTNKKIIQRNLKSEIALRDYNLELQLRKQLCKRRDASLEVFVSINYPPG